MHRYTVLLLYPDYINDGGQETYLAHIEANDPGAATCKAQKEAVTENSPEDIIFPYDPTDFHPLFICAGHQDDLRQ